MSCRSRDLYDNGFLVEGSAVLSRQHLNKAIPYKYVVVKGKSSDYEYIYKPQQSHEHVNRCLQVKAELLGSGGESPAGPLARAQACRRWASPSGQSSAERGSPWELWAGTALAHAPGPWPPASSSALKKPKFRSPFLISVMEPLTSQGKPGKGL